MAMTMFIGVFLLGALLGRRKERTAARRSEPLFQGPCQRLSDEPTLLIHHGNLVRRRLAAAERAGPERRAPAQ
jgi:hypothetical protein